jgi:hypothetical protein
LKELTDRLGHNVECSLAAVSRSVSGAVFYMRRFVTRTEAENIEELKPNYKVQKEEVLEYVQRRMERLYSR